MLVHCRYVTSAMNNNNKSYYISSSGSHFSYQMFSVGDSSGLQTGYFSVRHAVVIDAECSLASSLVK